MEDRNFNIHYVNHAYSKKEFNSGISVFESDVGVHELLNMFLDEDADIFLKIISDHDIAKKAINYIKEETK